MPIDGDPGCRTSTSGGWPVVAFAEIDSTSSEAMRRAGAGERGPLWIRADRQLAGRGRAGRAWASEPGNLYASLLLAPTCPPSATPQLSLVAGVAVLDAVRSAELALGSAEVPGLRLKWPNDVLIGTAKLAGILVESTTIGDRLAAVIGIGINLLSSPAAAARPATDLSAHGIRLSPDAMLNYLSVALAAAYMTWDEGRNFAAIRSAWLMRAGPSGERMSVNTGAGQVEGEFAGLDDGGALLLREADGTMARFTFGDVALAGGQGRE
jgi:BirA family biotin operon repressor/biotin-[acetyl-CoA-carboxylase] ligase